MTDVSVHLCSGLQQQEDRTHARFVVVPLLLQYVVVSILRHAYLGDQADDFDCALMRVLYTRISEHSNGLP